MRRIAWLIAISQTFALQACNFSEESETEQPLPAVASPPAAPSEAPAAPAAPAGATYRCDMIAGTGTCQELPNVGEDLVEVNRAMCMGQFAQGSCPTPNVSSRCTVSGLASYVLFSYTAAGGAPVELTTERLQENCSFLSGQFAAGAP